MTSDPPLRPRGAGLGDSRRVLYVNRNCYLDDSNGAAVASRGMMELLGRIGFGVEALTGAGIELGDEVDPRAWLASRGVRIEAGTSLAKQVVNGVPTTILVGHPARAGGPDDAESREFLAALDQTITRFRPDVLLTFGGDQLAHAIRARARRRGLAVVFALHNFAYNVRWPFADVDAAIVPSRFAADYYRRVIGLDCSILPNPVALGRVQVRDYRPRYVTFVNPSLEKGVYPFARIADELARLRPDIPLLVVEARGSERTLAACGLDLAGNGNISLMSHTADPRRFWEVTRICLLPSVWWENQPLVAVEALINGIPVVASDRGGIPETLGDSGVVLPLPDRITPRSRELPTPAEVEPWVEAIVRLWDDTTFWTERHRRASIEARRWSPPVIEPAYASFFARIRPSFAIGHGRSIAQREPVRLP